MIKKQRTIMNKLIDLSDVCVCKENKILPQDEKGMVLYAYLNANLPLL